ncbi:MAG: NAD(P)H-dependent oxidoreductase [Gammaproteobacteria bacterium]|nr:NAD(P)H-dependent oxidoreductase [Gammaproteobacteria bacterium]
MDTKIKVIAICGSLRKDSLTKRALEVSLTGAKQLGVEVQLVDLRTYNLVFCDGNTENDYPEDVIKLRQQVKNAHGVILGTPEYHGSYSGVLKNALDLMGFEEFEGKMIGLIGVSAGALGANNAISTLRSVGRSLHAWVVPDQVSIPLVDSVFADGKMEPETEKRLLNLGRQVAKFSYLHSSTHAQEFIEAWEAAPSNPGAKY